MLHLFLDMHRESRSLRSASRAVRGAGGAVLKYNIDVEEMYYRYILDRF